MTKKNVIRTGKKEAALAGRSMKSTNPIVRKLAAGDLNHRKPSTGCQMQ